MTSEYDTTIAMDVQASILHACVRDAQIAGGLAPHVFEKSERYEWQCLAHDFDARNVAHPCSFLPAQHFADAAQWADLPADRIAIWTSAAARLAEHNALLIQLGPVPLAA